MGTTIMQEYASGTVVTSKRLANKIAAAKVYEAAMKKAGGGVPVSVQGLARRAS
ncbi:hypothetical protein [Arthrobacter sp. C152]